jgi:hypothetical protein
MSTFSSIIHEIRLEGFGTALLLDIPKTYLPKAGQYYQAFAPELSEAAALALFPCGMMPGETLLHGDIPLTWGAGTNLQLRGPLGKGFNIPASAGRVVLAAWQTPAVSLRPLIGAALAQGAAVVVYGSDTSPDLPADVEANPLDQLPEALDWASYLAVETQRQDLPALAEMLAVKPGHIGKCNIEVHVRTPLVCGGVASCGVCAVPLHKGGYGLACKDGPVFRWEELGEE